VRFHDFADDPCPTAAARGMVFPANSIEGFYREKIPLGVMKDEGRIFHRKTFGQPFDDAQEIFLKLILIRKEGDFIEAS
jgi:hypothetical protein